MMWMIAIVPCLCLCFYCGYVFTRAIHYRKLIQQPMPEAINFPVVSVIVAARNEAQTLPLLLRQLMKQNYPKEKLEVIVVNDHSEDETAAVVRAAMQHDVRIHLCELTDTKGKKAAIVSGIAQARGTWIVTTDADCSVGTNWIASLAKWFTPETGLVSGPVALNGEGWFAGMQQLEFMGLNAVGAASIHAGVPNMCNGANLAYRKDAFASVNGFEGTPGNASGDDEFLMHKIHAQGKWSISFATDREAVVETHSQSNVSSFLSQRKRWVSKSAQYKRRGLTLILALTWIGMLSFPLMGILSFIQPMWLWALAGAFVLKMMAEFSLLAQAAVFFNNFRLLWLLVPEQLLHIVYVLWIGLAGNLGDYEWKGRKAIHRN